MMLLYSSIKLPFLQGLTILLLLHPEKYYDWMHIYEPELVVQILVTYYDYREAVEVRAGKNHSADAGF